MGAADDTIFAVSSGMGKAGVAVIRISGTHSAAVVKAVAGGVPEARRASVRSIRGRNGDVIDRGLVLWLPGPGSFTGEDMAELQVHGGRGVIAAVVGFLGELDGLRAAEAGEFARRAFGNGRLDLSEVEGLADLIDAETAAQVRQAVRQLSGGLGKVCEEWRERLVGVMGLCEAGIDFSDEDDVPAGIAERIRPTIDELRGEIGVHVENARRGEAIREGLVVVIAGLPNVGKSSLMNALARRDVAIVSEIAGTTRDAIAVRLDLGGVPVTLVDTAGVRESGDVVEMEGVRRALAHAEDADLVMWVREAGSDSLPERLIDDGYWLIDNKIDKGGPVYAVSEIKARFSVSALTGLGLEGVINALELWVSDRVGGETEVIVTRERHRHELDRAAAALGRARLLDYVRDSDLVAEELRVAADALGRITGRVDVEDVLGAIFAEFCIGK